VARSRRLIADKAFDADSLLRWLQDRRIKAVVPSTTTRTVSYPPDHRAYKRRDVIERLFCRLKTGESWPRATIALPGTISPASPSSLSSASGPE
jgi:transposase